MPDGIFKEYVIETNDFKQPKIHYGKKAIGVLLVRLLLLEPGTDPMRPDMGVGLVSKYRYMFPDGLSDLKVDIYKQVQTYLAPYSQVSITLTIENKELHIEIKIDDNTYKYETVQQEDHSLTLKDLLDESTVYSENSESSI